MTWGWVWSQGWCLCDRPSSDDSWGRGRNVDEACLVAVLGWDLTLRHLTAQRVFGIGDKAAAWGHLWILSTSLATSVDSLHGVLTCTGVVTAIVPLLALSVTHSLVYTHSFGEGRSWEWVGIWHSRWLRGRGIGGSREGSFGSGSVGEFGHIRVEDTFWFLATWVGRILCEVAFTWQLTISWAFLCAVIVSCSSISADTGEVTAIIPS